MMPRPDPDPDALRSLLRAGLGGNDPPDSLPGSEIRPGLRLLEVIGEGGAGRVFLAEETSPLRRSVAVKCLHLDHTAADWRGDFAREAEALARLDHPNIARIFESGIDARGVPYYSLELVDGPPLTHFCDRQDLDPPARLRLFQEICRAVHHAHRRGVLHGDLKPGNILVALDELGTPVPKLIDFAALGVTRRRFGTPGFAGPEQYGGWRSPDTRTDVYGLGRVLRELLLSHGRITLPVEAGWIVDRATAPVPESRYASADALQEDVQRLLDSRPLAAAPCAKGRRYRLARFARRHRVALTVLVLLAMGALILGQFLRQRLRRVRVAERGARAASHVAWHGATQADIARRLSLVGKLQAEGRYDDAEGELQTAGSLVARLPPEDTPWRLDVQRALARNFLLQRRYPPARRLLEHLVALADDSVESWESRLDLIRLHLASREFELAETLAAATIEAARRRFAPDHPIRLRALHLSGRTHVERFRYPEAQVALAEAAAGFRRHFGPDSAETRQAVLELVEVEQVLRDQERLPAKSVPPP